jgi:hypothetical protein
MQDTAVQELATLHEQSQALTCIAVQLQQDTSAARQDLASAQDTARWAACKGFSTLHAQVTCILLGVPFQTAEVTSQPAGVQAQNAVCLQLHISSMC